MIGDKYYPGSTNLPGISAPQFVPTVQGTVQKGLDATLQAALAAAAKAAADAAKNGTSWLESLANDLPGNKQPITANQIVPTLMSPIGLIVVAGLAYFVLRKK